MKYCSNCANPVVFKQIKDDAIPRFFCEKCHTVHYQNPKIVAGCLPVWEDKVLLCRRAIEPQYGMWNIPAGFMENGETVKEGALREAWEEAFAKIEIDRLVLTYSIRHVNQVCIFFVGQLQNLDFKCGIETLEVKLFEEKDIPWEEIAFSSSYRCIEAYFQDRKSGNRETYVEYF